MSHRVHSGYAFIAIRSLLALLPAAASGQVPDREPDFTVAFDADGGYRVLDASGQQLTDDLVDIVDRNPGAFIMLRPHPEGQPNATQAVSPLLLASDVVVGTPARPETRTIDGFGLIAVDNEPASAGHDLQRFAECLNKLNTDCLRSLTYLYEWNDMFYWTEEEIRERGIDVREMRRRLGPRKALSLGPRPMLHQIRLLVETSNQRGYPAVGYFRIEVSEPLAFKDIDPARVIVAQYDLTTYLSSSWSQRRSYLIGISDDGGSSWMFADDAVFENLGLDVLVPDAADRDLPAPLTVRHPRRFATESEYLATRLGGFVLRDDGGEGHYELAYKVMEKIDQQIPLILVFENPANPDRPYAVQSMLVSGQRELRITSPLITGFEPSQIYRVSVIGLDPNSDRVLFEHLQELYFFPIPARDGQFSVGVSPEPAVPRRTLLPTFQSVRTPRSPISR